MNHFDQKNTQLRTDRSIFLCLVVRLYNIPLSTAVVAEQLLMSEFRIKDKAYATNNPIEVTTLGALKLCCERDNVSVDFTSLQLALDLNEVKVTRAYLRLVEKYEGKALPEPEDSRQSNMCFNILKCS